MFKRDSYRNSANPFEFLAALRHEWSVEEHIECFERLASHITDLPEEQYLGYFLNGQGENIRRKISVFEPRDVMRAMDLARMLEEKISRESVNQRTDVMKEMSSSG